MSTSDDLKQAYRLIKRDQPEEARAIIRPILEAEPENVHAWWLLAYTGDDPNEVRRALNKVLELDPNYSNAPKAREMLAALNEQFPPEDASEAPAETFGEEDSLFAESAFGAAAPAETFDSFDDSFGDNFASVSEDFFASEDLFRDLEDETPAEATAPARSKPLSKEDLKSILEPEKPIDMEARASQEEKRARRQGRGGQLLRLALIAITIPVLVVVALFAVFSGDGEPKKDPGELQPLETQPDAVTSILVAAGSELRLSGLSAETRVVVAETQMGSTMFVELCGQPGPSLPPLVTQSMDIAARQAQALEGQLDAVGVSVNLCDSEPHDTLYRAFVSLSDAARYASGELGEGEAGQAAFQGLWQTS